MSPAPGQAGRRYRLYFPDIVGFRTVVVLPDAPPPAGAGLVRVAYDDEYGFHRTLWVSPAALTVEVTP